MNLGRIILYVAELVFIDVLIDPVSGVRLERSGQL